MALIIPEIPENPLSEADQVFVVRLMANPKAALSWAQEAVQSGSDSDRSCAFVCALASDASWDASERLSALSARLAALAKSHRPKTALRELLKIWGRENEELGGGTRSVGYDGMVETMACACHHGVEPDLAEELAESAAKDPSVRAWLDSTPPERVLSMFEGAVSFPAGAPSVWQEALARRLAPAIAVKKLADLWTSNSMSLKMPGLSPRGARALARSALSCPSATYILLKTYLMTEARISWGLPSDGPDPLVGIFEELAENPRPAMLNPEEVGIPLSKLYGSSKGAISLAMELMCKRRVRAGVAAARWASALGGAGRNPVAERTDGMATRRFVMAVNVFSAVIDWGSRSVAVRSIGEPALLLRDAEACEALRKMGWGAPNKARARELAEELGVAARASAKPGAKPRGFGVGAGQAEDAASSLMSFWESTHLARSLDVSLQSTPPSAVRRTRI